MFDPNEKHTLSAEHHHSDCDDTLFEGRRVQGKVKEVFLRGQMIVDGEQWLGRPGSGEFQMRGEAGGF